MKRIPNEWKRWTAANLMQGVSIEQIKAVLLQQGFSEMEVAIEIESASKHPYVHAGMQVSHTLSKRNWLINTFDSLAALDPGYATQVDVIDTPPFEVFIKKYYSKNLPVVLKNGINHWDAMKKWKPSYFAETLGDAEVEIQFDREKDPQFERNSIAHKKRMTISEFVKKIEEDGASNDYYMTANNTNNSIDSIKPIFNDIGDFGDGYRELTDDPSYLSFFWMGPKGTFTPLHHDLTNNMLVQVYGKKKVTLVPSWQVPFLYNTKHVFSDSDFPDFDVNTHPAMQHVTPVEVIIDAGDALFIPIAWWHCVESLDKSISISFTNFRAPNGYSDSFPSN